MIKTIMASAVAMALVSFGANAANQGQGVVNFKGTVIDAPCGIAPESADQTVDFGQISKTHLKDGISQQQNVDIKLTNCDLTKDAGTWKTVTIAFSGSSLGDGTELGTTGDTGTAIKVSTSDGNFVKFDGTTSAGTFNLKTGDNTMRYSAFVKKATGAAEVKEGEFAAVANFNLTYQ
ncbi:TPA: type 1 fimbrial protein [Escherichia coli]|nr:type 1 fimbrial protein [Escherichia coli]